MISLSNLFLEGEPWFNKQNKENFKAAIKQVKPYIQMK